MPDRPDLLLSVLHTQWPGDLPTLVPVLDALGYHRFWTTEHHTPGQSGSPTLAAAVAAGLSTRLRVGTAGVMIQIHSPLTVAEDFRLLETLYPGRLDLGLIRNVPKGLTLPGLLDGRPVRKKEDFAARVEEVVHLARRQDMGRGRLHGTRVGPVAPQPTLPQLWLCGIGPESAALAGRLGMAYAFHHHIHTLRGTGEEGPAVLAAYHAAFMPTPEQPRPYTVVACYGLCAETEAAARAGWDAYFTGQADAPDVLSRTIPAPGFIGTPAQCREQVLALQQRYNADEIVVQMCAPSSAVRLDAYGLLAEASTLPVFPALSTPLQSTLIKEETNHV